MAILSGFSCTDAMRAMGKAVSRACARSPHAHQATTKCLCDMSHQLPRSRCHVPRTVNNWVVRHGYWDGMLYSSLILAPYLAVGGICGAWIWDIKTPDQLVQACEDPRCDCVA